MVRRGGNFSGRPRPPGSQRQQRPNQRARFGGSRTAGQTSIPPRNRGDIRCINCGGTGHGVAACPEPQRPKEKRPCLLCGKPGHLARDCKSAPQAKVAEGDTQGRTFEIRIAEDDTGAARQRGRPIEPTYDSEGFQLVTGGFVPKPSGARLRDFVRSDGQNFSGKNRFAAISSDISISSIASCESAQDKRQGTDETLACRNSAPRAQRQTTQRIHTTTQHTHIPSTHTCSHMHTPTHTTTSSPTTSTTNTTRTTTTTRTTIIPTFSPSDFPAVHSSFGESDREKLREKGFDTKELGCRVRDLVEHWHSLGRPVGSEGGMSGCVSADNEGTE